MVNACACMGPQRGDPYCYCEMVQRGLTPTPAPEGEWDAFRKALAEFLCKGE